MPREAARIFLRIKAVRAERLLDITPAGIRTEGFKCGDSLGNILLSELIEAEVGVRNAWDKKHGKKYPWESNPYCFVYEFERIEKPEVAQ